MRSFLFIRGVIVILCTLCIALTSNAQYTVYVSPLGYESHTCDNSGNYTDIFSFVVNDKEELIEIDLDSPDFETYLMVVSPTGTIYRHDDHISTKNKSFLRILSREIGTWRLAVSTPEDGGSGIYTLTMNSRHLITEDKTFVLTENVCSRDHPPSYTDNYSSCGNMARYEYDGPGSVKRTFITSTNRFGIHSTSESVCIDYMHPKTVFEWYLTSNEIPVNKVTITVKEPVSGVDLKVKLTDESRVPAGLYGDIYQYLDISATNLENENIESAYIEFEVPKKWVESHTGSPGKIRTMHFEQGKWNDISTVITGLEASVYEYNASTTGFSPYAIAGEATNEEPITADHGSSTGTISNSTANNPTNGSQHSNSETGSGISGTTDTESTIQGNAVDRIMNSLKNGRAGFNLLPELEVGEAYELVFSISGSASEEEITTSVQQATSEKNDVEIDDIKINDRMKAHLNGAGKFDIHLVDGGNAVRAVAYNGITQWKWSITPKESGEHKIYLNLYALEEVDGEESDFQVSTFSKEITVQVNFMSLLAGFIAENWQWLWAVIIVPVAGWFWKKKNGSSESSST